MAKLTSNTNWVGSNSQTTKSQTYTFSTGGKYVDKDIKFTVNINGVSISAPATGEDTFYIEVPNGTSGTKKFYFHVTSDSNVYVTESVAAVS